jgi:hypothetical protein
MDPPGNRFAPYARSPGGRLKAVRWALSPRFPEALRNLVQHSKVLRWESWDHPVLVKSHTSSF